MIKSSRSQARPNQSCPKEKSKSVVQANNQTDYTPTLFIKARLTDLSGENVFSTVELIYKVECDVAMVVAYVTLTS